MKVGIIGASGYSGETLIRLLSRHPKVELACVTSRQWAGQRVDSVLPAMSGLTGGLCFSASKAEDLAQSTDIDLFFLALPHGVAAEYAAPLVEAGKRVIDLSADFRLNCPQLYQSYYGKAHPAPELLAAAPYVLPEWSTQGWQQAQLIACPGCYPTSVLIPLLPLLQTGVVAAAGIVVNSLSGISGAGKKAEEYYSFCERESSVVAYGVPRHRHLSEIEEQLTLAAAAPVVLQFTPHLIPVARGIATTIVAKVSGGVEAVYNAWSAQYANRPFIRILPAGKCPETRHVVHSNRVDMSAQYDPRTGNIVITSAIDNLVKGASGQAVQIMNLWLGFAETDGLL